MCSALENQTAFSLVRWPFLLSATYAGIALEIFFREVNPRDLFRDIVHAIHEREIFTPSDYAIQKSATPA
jgi:hypothetical protein